MWASRLGGHELAVKVFKESMWADAVFEASIAERLDHPNVVRLLDCVADGKVCYLVYERAGCSLASCLRGEFPSGTSAPITGFVAIAMKGFFEGVAYIHSHGGLPRRYQASQSLGGLVPGCADEEVHRRRRWLCH